MTSTLWLIPLIIVVIIVGGLAIFMWFQKSHRKIIAPTRLSHLKCPKCGYEFDCAWIPGASFTLIRFINSRFI